MGQDGAAGVCATGSDCCPNDANKTEPGECGCNVADTDSDQDGVPDCIDTAPYGWHRLLTLDGAQVSESLTDFPVLVRITDEHLKSEAAVSGSDIHFSPADDKSLLDYEIESYDSATGALVAWVRMPNLTAGADSVLYLGYGDGQNDRSNATGVWATYHNVWHMAQDPGPGGNGAIKDSTRRADGTPQGNMTSANVVGAVAGNGISFDGVDDQIAFTNDIVGAGGSTIGAWVNLFQSKVGPGYAVIGLGGQSYNGARYLLALERSSGTSKVGFHGSDLHAKTFTSDKWTHFVWSWNGTYSSIYVNGVRIAGPTFHTGANTSGSLGRIGNGTFMGPDDNFFLLGELDEVRVATAAHSSGWVATEYKSQRPGSTFIKSVGPAQPAGGAGGAGGQ